MASKKKTSGKAPGKKPKTKTTRAMKTPSTKKPAANKSVDPATYKREPRDLADDFEIDVVAFEKLGDASVLHLSIGGGRMSLVIEPAQGTQFTEGAITVPSARDGAAIVEAIANWLSQPAPVRPRDTVDPPPPMRIGLIELQRGATDDGRTWQRTKLCFGISEELYLIWETSGAGASLSEKDPATRESLLEVLAFALRDGVYAEQPTDAVGADPLRRDPVPLVTSLLRVPVQPAGVVGHFWRDGRYHVPESLGDRSTAIVAIATDGSFERIATIPARTRYLCASGPHVVATVELPDFQQELWIVGPGETTGRLLIRDPNFRLGQMCDVVCSPDGSQIAVTGTDGRTNESSTRILAPDGALIAETDETYPDRWENGSFIYSARPRRFEVYATKQGAIAIADRDDDTTRVIEPASKQVRDTLLKYEHALRGAGTIVAGTCFTLDLLGDLLLIDGVTLKTWSIIPKEGGLKIDDAFEWIAIKPYGGGLLIGRIDDRWRTGAAATETEAIVRARLAKQLAGECFAFDGVQTRVEIDAWAKRLGLAPAEIVRRLEAKGREKVADARANIDAALAAWSTDPDAAAHKAAGVSIPGAASAVWSMIAHRKSRELDERDRKSLAATLRRLAAAQYERLLQRDENVAALLAEAEGN